MTANQASEELEEGGQSAAKADAAPKGLGGWLILVILGLIVSPLRIGHSLATEFWPILRDGAWAVLTTPGGVAYHPLWGPLLVFEFIGNVAVIVLGLVTLVLLLQRSRHTPRLAIAWFAWQFLFIACDFFAINLIPAAAGQQDADSVKELVRATIATAIWVPYFLVSKRVKATFVE